MDDSLCPAGYGMGARARRIILILTALLNGAVSCNTAQSYQYLLAAAGEGTFLATVNELGLRVQHCDGTVEGRPPVDFAPELEAMRDYLADNVDHPLTLVSKSGGFAVKQSRGGVDASEQQIAGVNNFVEELAEANPEITSVITAGHIDLFGAGFDKGAGAMIQMGRAPFIGKFSLGAGDGFTYEDLFEVMDLSIKVGDAPTSAQGRVADYLAMLDVLQWIIDLLLDDSE